VADVQAGADVRREKNVAGDDRLLGDRRPALQAEHPGQLALVHLGALGEARLLRVLRDDAAERLDVFQRPPHQHRVGDAMPVVGEDPHPGCGVGHRAELGQPLTGEPDGDRPDGLHITVTGLATEPPHLLDHPRGVGDRVGVGHCVHGGEPAQRSRGRAGLDGLGVLATRLAQVRVQVDQPWKRDQPVGVDRLGAGLAQARPDLGKEPVLDEQVGGRTAQQARAPDQKRRRLAHAVASGSPDPDRSR
jgi:hypothetical protein